MGELEKDGKIYFVFDKKISIFKRFLNFLKYKDIRCLFENCIPITGIVEVKLGDE